MFQMWTIGNMVAVVMLTGLSVMDIRIRKVPRDLLVLCMTGAILYQILLNKTDWRLSVAGGAAGIVFLGISKLTREAIGYGDSFAILILGIYIGIWGLLEILATAFFMLAIAGIICLAAGYGKKRLAFPFYPFLTVGYLVSMYAGGR